MVVVVISGSGWMKADGKTHDIMEGYVFFIGQGTEVTYKADARLEIYAAYAE